jgi:hypothetical protein
MAILPYMHQLPQDYYLKNLPVVPPAVVEEVLVELTAVEAPVLLGIPLPPPTGGGIPEAPNDGKTYARQSIAWTSNWDGGSY